MRQGATPYRVNNDLFVNGDSVTIKWANDTEPEGKATNDNYDIYYFTIINVGTEVSPAWVVLGSYNTGFGGSN